MSHLHGCSAFSVTIYYVDQHDIEHVSIDQLSFQKHVSCNERSSASGIQAGLGCKSVDIYISHLEEDRALKQAQLTFERSPFLVEYLKAAGTTPDTVRLFLLWLANEPKLSALTSLDLSILNLSFGCSDSSDNLAQALNTCKHLEVLRLPGCSAFCRSRVLWDKVFSCMQQLTTLRELAFDGCDGCSSEDWLALCQSLASLQRLQKLCLSQVMWRAGSVRQHQFASALQRLTRLAHLHVAYDKWMKEDVQQLVAGL